MVHNGVLAVTMLLLNDKKFMARMSERLAIVIGMFVVVPQFYRSHTRDSTEGLSDILVFIWTIGDFIEFIYNVMSNKSMLMLMVAAFKMLVDLFLLLKIWIYENEKIGHNKSE